jgi:hypothetical protein
VSEELLTYEQCVAWAEKFKEVPWKDLALAVAVEREASPMRVMRSLFSEIVDLQLQVSTLHRTLNDIANLTDTALRRTKGE